ncbi:hypothetical protein HUA74_33635 [Myxococcus sp. CA051A]|uniref:hypothetical protein n=1 Tax=unclassified Myxococcus TaxID=2648731 RepID=UPI00157A3360|nr:MULTISPECIES: hypothetical protein [unclassified Myxococcus]NTX11952.1 hypothetical protein [Myxococcus sp. CA056]NTX65613.1 hypothetical protein [Myxococcus sp. CA051A]
MRRALAGLVLLLAGCATTARPTQAPAVAEAAPPVAPEPEQPRYEHIFMIPVDKALAEATKLMTEKGWVLKPLEDPRYLLTEWRTAQLSAQSWGWQSDGDSTRYLVAGELISERESVIRIFRMKRVAFSNDVEIKPEASGQLNSRFMLMERFEQSFVRRGAPVELAQRERDVAPWVELNGAVQGTRDLELEQTLTLRLESRPSLETLTGSLRLARDDSFARDPSFYLTRWKDEVPEPCAREVAGFQSMLRPGLTVLIGEQLGTREIPATVGDLACEAVQTGLGVTVALAIPEKEQERINTYLASPGRPADQDALLRGNFWRKLQQDGRGSRAVMDLIDRVRALRAAGRSVFVVAMDTDMNHGKARDAYMARKVLNPRSARPQDVFLVLAGNAHTRLGDADWSDDFVPMSKHLLQNTRDLKVLEVGYAQGRRWGCDLELNGEMDCNIMGITPGPQVAIRPEAPAAIRMLPELDDEGFHGFLDVGVLTASLPAIALRGHEPPEPSVPGEAPGPANLVTPTGTSAPVNTVPPPQDTVPPARPPTP